MADQIAVVGGVDTHTDSHQAAVIDTMGRHLATAAQVARSSSISSSLSSIATGRDRGGVGCPELRHAALA